VREVRVRLGVIVAACVVLVAGCHVGTSSAGSGGAATSNHAAPVPRVVGQRLVAAEHALSAAGFHDVKPVDDTGRNRIVIDPENWTVDSQTPAGGTSASTGTTVTLKVRRPTDAGGTTSVTRGVIPDVTCMNLQDAQDTLQSAGFLNLASVDGLGQGRQQILDRDWLVTNQSRAAGSRPKLLARIVLTAVKYGESTGASGCRS
jgi:beta-lactam-binding protein with PASTA domain